MRINCPANNPAAVMLSNVKVFGGRRARWRVINCFSLIASRHTPTLMLVMVECLAIYSFYVTLTLAMKQKEENTFWKPTMHGIIWEEYRPSPYPWFSTPKIWWIRLPWRNHVPNQDIQHTTLSAPLPLEFRVTYTRFSAGGSTPDTARVAVPVPRCERVIGGTVTDPYTMQMNNEYKFIFELN